MCGILASHFTLSIIQWLNVIDYSKFFLKKNLKQSQTLLFKKMRQSFCGGKHSNSYVFILFILNIILSRNNAVLFTNI